ncbi:S-layer homology domain-containing protein, partial [Oscillospiraceae bacterium OttesenSCG-928-F05]|nr:S-layer homology domain-containing protein [Oscillospiraceae bacterium OttesenSCG-928-F05]
MRHLKKCLCLFLAIALLLPASAFAETQPSPAHTLLERGYLTEADAALEETAEISRGHFFTYINRVFGFFTTTAGEFSDLTPESPWYYEVLAAYRAGYLKGHADGTVRPDAPVTKAQAAVIYDRICALPDPDSAPVFSDAERVPAYALESLKKACALGLIPGTDADGAICSGDAMTAGEVFAGLLAAVNLQLNAARRQDQLLEITAEDGYTLEGRLSLPAGDAPVEKIVLFINGTGPNTYENRRQSGPYRFNYFDYFADSFTEDGTAFFSYTTRGVSPSEEGPYFYTVDDEPYSTYTPQMIAKDVASMAAALRETARLEKAELYLLGWSEGAIIAPLTVLTTDIEVSALLLAGYPNDNMRDILVYQLLGEQTFFIYTIYFGAEGEDAVTREQYDADPYGVIDLVFGGLSFDETDLDGDGLITQADFADTPRAELGRALFEAIDRKDTPWIKENFMELTWQWFEGHFALEKTEDMLAQIDDLPIHIF